MCRLRAIMSSRVSLKSLGSAVLTLQTCSGSVSAFLDMRTCTWSKLRAFVQHMLVYVQTKLA